MGSLRLIGGPDGTQDHPFSRQFGRVAFEIVPSRPSARAAARPERLMELLIR